jgi:hypothetical protein
MYFPIFSAYYSPVFGGTAAAQKTGVYDSSGEYFADAAFYLNNYSRDTVVYLPDNVLTFTPFYKGKTIGKFNNTVDYVVSSIDLFRDMPKNASCTTLDKTLFPR